MPTADDQATCCATLVDEWIGSGIGHAVVAPGSRSTPMALALAGRDDVRLHVVHDERVAGFVGLGLGLAGIPAVVLCTSGTAAANLHPAVVEAGLSDVPVLVVTADRPPELRDVGAAQTIDQTHLFGRSVRWFHDPGVPTADLAGTWRSLARRSFTAATDAPAGPVHLNLPFREPLVGTPGELPPPLAPRSALSNRPKSVDCSMQNELDDLDRQRGVIVAGGRSGVAADVIAALAAATGWPVLADPTSGATGVDGAITTADALLRHPAFARDHTPELIVRIGRPPASRVVNEWLAESAAPVVQVGGPGVIDPDHHVVAVVGPLDVTRLAQAWTGATGTPWAARWRHAAARAETAIDDVLGAETTLTEPSVARTIARHLPAEAELVVASSMPVRDLEWYGGTGARGHANRGANGIDGVVSTALGVALGGPPTVALVGDLAFLHDAGALTALAGRAADLRIVVVDNDGGGIFSFLPQATALAPERFEQLYGTPHGTDLVAVGRAHGLDTATVATADELVARLGRPGPSVTVVRTDRVANVDVHRRLSAAVAAALG